MGILSQEAIISVTVALAHLALFLYLLAKRGGALATANWLKSYLALASSYLALTALWNLLLFIQAQGWLQIYLGLAWRQLYLYPLVLISMAIWGFAHLFLDTQAGKRLPFIASGIVVIIMGLIEFGLVPLPTMTMPISNQAIDRQMITYGLGLITIIIFLAVALYTGIRVQRETYSPRHRNRIKILLLALSLFSFGIASYLSLLPLIQNVGLIVQWLGAPILIYIVLNQNLPDINTGIKEFISFLIITFMTLVFYGATIYGLEVALVDLPNALLTTAVITAILLTIFYLPTRRLTQRLIELVLFRHNYNYEQIIKDYIQTINNILFINDLVTVSLNFITKNLNIQRGAFFLLNAQDEEFYHFIILSNLAGGLPKQVKLKKETPLTEQLIDSGYSISQYVLDLYPEFKETDHQGVKVLKRMAFEQYMPIKRNHILVGIIAVGPFASGEPYSIRDIELFSTLAAQTAIALENARLFENVRHNLEEITRIKDLMDNVFASIRSGVITVGTNNELLMVNEAAYTILNLPQTVQPGTNVEVLLPLFGNTALPALLRDVKSTQRNYRGYEFTLEIEGRGIVNLSIDLNPIRDAQKRLKGVALVINDLTEQNRLQAVQDMFRTYLSPAVVDRLPNDPTELKLGGQRQEVSILFADIRGFTTFSELQRPEDLITILNKYLSIAAEAILVYEGTLDKFMGDAVMAIFNAPLSQQDHPLRAVKAAAAMQEKLSEYHRMIGEYAPHLEFGVGIHVGEAVVGNVGTNSRMDYTAIGDGVNLAKRIQENTPGGKILLSQATYNRVKEFVNAVPYQTLPLKGRKEAEPTYELLNILPVRQLAQAVPVLAEQKSAE